MECNLTLSSDSIKELQSVFKTLGDAIIILDELHKVVFCNSTVSFVLGNCNDRYFFRYIFQEFKFYNCARTQEFKITHSLIKNFIKEKDYRELKLYLHHKKSGDGIWLNIIVTSLNDRRNLFKGSTIICRDISQTEQPEAERANNLLIDRLTGCHNRKFLLQKIESNLKKIQTKQEKLFAVILLDLDRFKLINDSLGHEIGDRLLIALSRRLEACLRQGDLVVRLDGDEFAIFLDNIKNINCATQITDRIYKELILPFNLNEHEIFVDVSIGIAMSNLNYQRSHEILRDADLAMRHAKKLGKSCYQVFNTEMQARAMEVLKLENDLRRASEREEFVLHYQPIVLLENRTIIGFEALLRWQHPERGLIYPSEFISIAEETGLINSIGAWVLKEACHQMKIWQSQFSNSPLTTISVNVSGKQFLKADFIHRVKNILQETNLDSHCLKLEITETILVENNRFILNTIEQLKKLGIQLSMDDFGTGYSSLSYLHNFPINTLKIDRSFVQRMNDSSQNLGIIRAIVALAFNLKMEVVAEGIETASQLAGLKVLKCTYGQGYFFAKPLAPKAVETLLESELLDSNKQKEMNSHERSLEERITREQFLIHIERLQQELEELKQEKQDLEILLETTTEHSDMVEFELQKEISDRLLVEANLQKANQELESLSCIDSLTGVANRRRFDSTLEQEWQRMMREQKPLSLIFCDVDHFKKYNDRYGHQAGDRCLQQVAKAIHASLLRSGDLVARYGGEEFAVILPNTDAYGAIEVAKRIKSQLANLQIVQDDSSIGKYVTASLGVVSLIPTSQNEPEFLIAQADKALYQAKEQGRDRFVVFCENLDSSNLTLTQLL
jgi:diguanylate cyclase (GGDEF)-like protein